MEVEKQLDISNWVENKDVLYCSYGKLTYLLFN